MDAAFVDAEMALFGELEGSVGDSRTFVYPRNKIAHADALSERGFLGFRDARPNRSRLRSLLSEFNLFEAPEKDAAGDGIIAIPAGYFLNWRSGARRLVPPAVTHMRAERLLDQAAAKDAVVHYWLHPENIATAPSTLHLLEALIRTVARRRDAGHCHVLTQLGYCAAMGGKA
jgi:hypothetical protein